MPRKVSKRSYKKRTYKPRRYKKRTYRRRFYKRSTIKKPEINIVSGSREEYPFNNATLGVGTIQNFTAISGDPVNGVDDLQYKLFNKNIEGSKVRLKYLYIKGYIKVSGTNEDDFNCKLMVFRWKRNVLNRALTWDDLINNNYNIPLSTPANWTEAQRLQMLYMQDWKNDIKINFYRRVKNLYRKYDDANNIIPFRIRIPLYDCVMTCDSEKNSNNKFVPVANPSTNGLYFTFLSNQLNENCTISYKWKLYYTDY